LLAYLAGKDTSYRVPPGVTSIGERAFYYCKSLSSITLPASLTAIGEYAFFYCESLSSITLLSGLTSIGKGAFSSCYSLSSISIDANNKSFTAIDGVLYSKDQKTLLAYPAGKWDTSYTVPIGVTTIGERAFFLCDNLSSITLPASLTTIEESAFFMCENLNSITLPAGLTSIGKEAFLGCNSLSSIILLAGVTTIGEDSFSGCYSLSRVYIPTSVKMAYEWPRGVEVIRFTAVPVLAQNTGDFQIEGTVLVKYKGAGGNVTVPTGITTIGKRAFYGCSSLSSIMLPASLTTIEEYAFSGCNKLSSIALPVGVTTIGDSAFFLCDSLISISVDVNNKSFTAIDDVLYSRDQKTLLVYPAGKQGTSYTVLSGVTTIGKQAFYFCRSLSSISVDVNNRYFTAIDGVLYSKDQKTLLAYPAGKQDTSYRILVGVTRIEEDTFSWCFNLSSITLPASLTTIGKRAFFTCSSLRSITLPASVTRIEDSAFSGCFRLISIMLPASLTTIGDSAFSGCSSLSSITLPAGLTTIGEYAFSGCDSLISVYIPNSVKVAYEWTQGVEVYRF
jgi:hypothetical protein